MKQLPADSHKKAFWFSGFGCRGEHGKAELFYADESHIFSEIDLINGSSNLNLDFPQSVLEDNSDKDVQQLPAQ